MNSVLIVLQLIFLEGVLSIDNAAVLGAMVAHLSTRNPVAWPPPLKALGAALHPLLGNQRTAALRVGLLGAYAGRGLMLALASVLVQNPWLRVAGAAYLVRLACNNLGRAKSGKSDAHVHPLVGRNFWNIVVTVELADLAFSLDNVVTAVALSNQLWVVFLGVALGILTMRFAAGWFSYAVEREPVLKTAAYVLVFNVSVQLLLDEFGGVHFTDWARLGIAAGTLLLALAYARLPALHAFQPLLNWLGEGFASFNQIFDWALEPVQGLARLAWHGLRRLGRLFQRGQ
jgi:tellurite resistance protein TerC